MLKISQILETLGRPIIKHLMCSAVHTHTLHLHIPCMCILHLQMCTSAVHTNVYQTNGATAEL